MCVNSLSNPCCSSVEFWALKIGGGSKKWQRRYFKLYPTALCYFKDNSKKAKFQKSLLLKDIDPSKVYFRIPPCV